MNKVIIRTDGTLTSVVIDGVEYSKQATEVVFKHTAGEIPTVSLTFPTDEVEITGSVGSVSENGRATESDTTQAQTERK